MKHIGLMCVAGAKQLGKDMLLLIAENIAVWMVPIRHLYAAAVSSLGFERVINHERNDIGVNCPGCDV